MGHTPPTLRRTAVSATLHCLAGCAIGEVTGLLIGTALGWPNFATFAVSIVLAFVFGYSLSLLPLRMAGLTLIAAMPIVLAADSLSILTMEAADNLIMALVPGALNAGLDNRLFWLTLPLSLVVAFIVAVPVNYVLLRRGRGHALAHQYHNHSKEEHNHA